MSSTEKPRRAESARPLRRWLIVAAVVVAVALIAGFVWRAQASGANPAPTPSIQATSTTATPTQTATPRPSPSAKPSSPKPPKPSSSTLPELGPVGLDSDSERPDGVVVRISRIEAVAGEAKLPGEVAGAALRLTVVIRNGSKDPLTLGTVVVNGYRGSDRTPLEGLTSPGGNPFSGTLAPSAEASGGYLFAVAVQYRSDVTFSVDATPGKPAAVFRGDAR